MVWNYAFKVLEHLQGHRRSKNVVLICLFGPFSSDGAENVENSFPKSTRSEWITLGGDIKTHYLAIPCEVSPNSGSLDEDKTAKDDDISTSMVMLHGTGSAASLAWSSSAETLSKQYSLYAPDLPGFGRSTSCCNLPVPCL